MAELPKHTGKRYVPVRVQSRTGKLAERRTQEMNDDLIRAEQISDRDAYEGIDRNTGARTKSRAK